MRVWCCFAGKSKYRNSNCGERVVAGTKALIKGAASVAPRTLADGARPFLRAPLTASASTPTISTNTHTQTTFYHCFRPRN